MAYLMSQETKEFVDKLKSTHSMISTPRKGWIFGGESLGIGNVAVCYITGGTALTGYNAKAYPSMAELRDDGGRVGGKAVTVYPCEIGLDGHLPVGTVVLCHEVLCRVTGGTENAEPEE